MVETMFTNKEALMPDFKLKSLEQFLCRENEIKSYIHHLQRVKETQCTELVVQGWGGTGVTTLSKLCLNLFKTYAEENDINLCIIHVDCNKYRTETAIYKYIIASLPEVIPKRKITNSRPYYLDYIEEFLDNYEGKLVIVFDDAEQMKNLDALEMFVRMGENKYTLDEIEARGKREVSPHLICTTHKINFAFDGNPSFLSRFNANRITLWYYNEDQLKTIYTTRAKMAFVPNAVSEEVISLIAKQIHEIDGDIKVGIEFLRRAGEIADKRGETQITLGIMREIFDDYYFKENLEDLDELQAE